ncbi:oxidoreductase [Schizosaccharomyces octosporus yFS286]|uniref:Oxidoreductase n=1 Tax=Schizosaccharomyces octosporus (strain yFS286) TaxID=483514 RepID=S9RF82_SCHOY|nr:oxidoreductase [Schizosaccharomyces octosporus yFS286]EPX72739.1 oxidoreductase [Schizosaccharomyces octosporus yFS286]
MESGKKPCISILCIGNPAITTLLGWRLQQSTSATCQETILFFNIPDAPISPLTIHSKPFGVRKYRPTFSANKIIDLANEGKVFDYILVSIKPCPHSFNLPSVIEPVVTKGHTCIVYNTTGSIGIEETFFNHFPENPVYPFSFHSGIVQRDVNEFHHGENTPLYLGKYGNSRDNDKLELLSSILSSGGVMCEIVDSLILFQLDDLAFPISLFPLTVLMQNPNAAKLLQQQEVLSLHKWILLELDSIANVFDGSIDIKRVSKQRESFLGYASANPMYKEYIQHKPMEYVSSLRYLVQLAANHDIKVPYMHTLSILLSNIQPPALLANHRVPSDLPTRPTTVPLKNKGTNSLRHPQPITMSADRLNSMPTPRSSTATFTEAQKGHIGAVPPSPANTLKARAMSSDNMDMLSLTNRRSRRSLHSSSLVQIQQSLKKSFDGLGNSYDHRFSRKVLPNQSPGNHKTRIMGEGKEALSQTPSSSGSPRAGYYNDTEPSTPSATYGAGMSRPNSNSANSQHEDVEGESDYFTIMNHPKNETNSRKKSMQSETSMMTVIPSAVRRFPLTRKSTHVKS